ncbi:MAG: NADH-quinone oxidoreductase subunit D [Rubrobacteridae bacterium]|nr:NADH-quinone oxidoreductase subunit D [Rubrobacteridae bacterium]
MSKTDDIKIPDNEIIEEEDVKDSDIGYASCGPTWNPEQISTDELILNVGPQHPSTHGVLRISMAIDGEVVTRIDPQLGYLHRCFEKIAEARTYTQFIPFTDRLDYISSMLNNWGYVMTVEKLADIEVPERAEYIRVLMGELNRISSHLIFYTTTGLEIGALTPFFWFFDDREQILSLFEKACGARLTYNYMRIGGVKADLPDGWVEEAHAFIKQFKDKLDEYFKILLGNYIGKKRMVGIGPCSAEDALKWGLTGPSLRASGVNYDIRKSDPYSIYPKLDFEVPLGENGDCYDRVLVRFREIEQSIYIIEQVLEMIPDGPVKAEGIPKVFRPPVGEAYAHVESSRGDLGSYVVSDGSTRPYRVKIQGPSFGNLQAFPAMGEGTYVSDSVIILGTLDPVFGEVDR